MYNTEEKLTETFDHAWKNIALYAAATAFLLDKIGYLGNQPYMPHSTILVGVHLLGSIYLLGLLGFFVVGVKEKIKTINKRYCDAAYVFAGHTVFILWGAAIDCSILNVPHYRIISSIAAMLSEYLWLVTIAAFFLFFLLYSLYLIPSWKSLLGKCQLSITVVLALVFVFIFISYCV